MAEFVLEKTGAESVQFAVHEQHCTQVKDKEELRYLGSYANAEAAYKKAVGWYSGVAYCPQCLPA